MYGDLCKHLGIDSSTDHPDRYSNLFLNAYQCDVDLRVHVCISHHFVFSYMPSHEQISCEVIYKRMKY